MAALKTSSKMPLKAVKLDASKRVIPKAALTKPRWWRVTLGKKMTGTGKIRRFFATEREANEFIAAAVAAARQRGHFAFNIPQKLAVEALELTRELEAHGVSLTQAVKFYLNYRAQLVGRSYSDLIPEYLRTKAKPEYRRAQEISLRLFEKEFGRKSLNGIEPHSIEKWLDGKKWQPLNRRNYVRDLAMFFNWAKLHGHVTDNPCDKVKRPKVPRLVPAIYTVDEVNRLLNTAREHTELGLLDMYAIAFFAGVRIGEILRMRAEMIDWEEGEIRLLPSVTKSGSPRNIEIFDALRAWIGEESSEKGPLVSPVNLRLRRQQLHLLAAVPMKRNALRHSFASYHSAKYRDPGGLQLLLGQETPNVLFRHYLAATRKMDALAFFESRPGSKPRLKPANLTGFQSQPDLAVSNEIRDAA
jgi:integrase